MPARRFRLGLLGCTALLPALALAQGVAPNAAPSGGRVVAGSASIAQSATTTTINQSSGRAAIDWNTFNVGANQAVQFNQPSPQSWTLNRVTTPDPSVIAGRITANGGIAIVNQSGVVFAEGAQVNVANLIASAAGIANQDFMAGRMAFTTPANPGARVENRGSITVADTGLAVLAGPRAANSGTINARLGHVALQGAEAFTLDLAGDGLLSLDVTQQVRSSPDGAALVTNGGVINARGGSVQLSASAISGVVETLVNNTGRIAVGGGQAVLRAEGGGVMAGGRISARSRSGQGGSISASATGDVVVPSGAVLDASGGAGGGRVAVGSASTRSVTVAAGAALRADATRRGNGGNVVVNSARSTTVQGQLSARGGPQGGDGGLVETSSGAALLLAVLPDVSAPAGRSGTWLLDPVNIIIRDSGAAGATETDGTLTVGAYSTNGASGNPTSVIIAPSVIEGYSGNVTLAATDTIGVVSAVTRTAGQGTLTLVAGNAVVLAAALSVADGLTLLSTTGNLSLAAPLSTARSAAMSLTAGGSVTQSAGNIITTGSLSVTAHGTVALQLDNVVDSVGISAPGQSVGFVSTQALGVTGLAATTANLRAPSLNITGASGATESVTLTATAGGIQQGATITTPALTLTATGGDIALGLGNAVDQVSISANGHAGSFTSANDLTVLASSAAALSVTGQSLSITGALGGTSSIALASTAGGIGQSGTGLLNTGALTATASGGDIALGLANPVNAASLTASGHAATLVSTAGLTLSGSAATITATAPDLALGALAGTTSIRLDATTGGVVHAGASGVLTTPDLGITAAGTVALGRQNGVDKVAISASGQAASFTSANALEVAASNAASLSLTGASLNLTGAVSGSGSVTLVSTAAGTIGQGSAGLLTTPSLTVLAHDQVQLDQGNSVSSLNLTSGGKAVFSNAAALTLAGADAGGDLTIAATGGLATTGLAQSGGTAMLGTTGGPVTIGSGGVSAATGLAIATSASVGNVDITVNGALQTSAGDAGVTAAGSVHLNANLTALGSGATTLTASAGDISMAAGTTASGGSVGLNALGSISAAAVQGASSVTMTASNGGITLNGATGAGSGGSVTLRADTLTFASGGSVATSGAGTVNLLPMTLSNGMTLGGSSGLTGAALDTISTGGGTLRIGSDGTHTISGTITLAGAVALRGTGHGEAAVLALQGGAVAGSGGSVNVARLQGSAGSGDFIADNGANTVDTLGPTTAAGVVRVASAGALGVAGAVQAQGTGQSTLTGASSLTLNASVTTGGTLVLASDGAIGQTAGSITTPLLQVGGASGATAASINLAQPGNAIDRLDSASATGSIAVTSSGAAGTGVFTVGDVGGQGVTLTATGTSGGSLALAGTIAAGTGTLDLHAAGDIGASGVLSGASIAANAGGAVNLSAGTGGGFTTMLASSAGTNFSFQQDGALTVGGAVTGSNVSVVTPANLTIGSTGSAAAGLVVLWSGTTSGGLVLNGPVSGTSGVLLLVGSSTVAANLTQGSGGIVHTPMLLLEAGGDATLTALNQASRLSGLVYGALQYRSAVGVSVSAATPTTGTILDSQSASLVSAFGSFGAASLTAPSITVGSGAKLGSIGGTLTLAANSMDLAGTVLGTVVTLQPLAADTGVQLGGSASGNGALLLDVAQVAALATTAISLQATGSGAVLLAADANLRSSSGARTLDLQGSSVTQASATSLSVDRVTGAATAGSFRLDNAGNAVDAAGTVTAAQDLSLRSTAAVLTLDGTLSAGSGRSITLRADDIALTGALQVVGAGTVNLLPQTAGTALSLGGASGYLGTAELARIDTGGGLLRVGSDGTTTTAGAITLAGNAALRSVAATLDLRGASVAQSGGTLDVATLTGSAGGGVGLGSTTNRVDTLAGFGAGQDLLLRDAAALTVTGATSVGNGRALTLQADALTLSAALSAPAGGSVTLLPLSSGRAMTLGDSSAPAGLYLPSAALDQVATGGGVLRLGGDGSTTTAGAITLAGDVRLRGSGHGDAGTLQLYGASVTQSGGLLDVAALGGATSGDFLASRGGNLVDRLVGIAAGGNLAVTSAAALLTVANQVSAGSGLGVTLRADALALAAPVLAPGAAGTVVLQPLSTDTGITVGASGSGLVLNPAQLAAQVATTTLVLQANGSGGISLAADLGLRGGAATVLALNGASVAQAAGSRLDVVRVSGSATNGGFALDSHANTVSAVGAVGATGDIALTTASATLTLGDAITVGNGRSVTLRADDIVLSGTVSAPGGGTVNVLPNTAGTALSLGGASAYLNTTELGRISTGGGLLRVGSDGTTTTAGAITLAGNVPLRSVAATLDLRGASVTQSAGTLDVATLTGATSGDFQLAGNSNSYDTLGNLGAANILVRDYQTLGVAGTVQVGAAGSLSIAARYALTIGSSASLQAGTRAGADTGSVNLWAGSIVLQGAVQAGSLVTLVANNSRSAGPTAAVAGADITQSGLGLVTTRRLGTAAAGDTTLTLANVVDRAALSGYGAVGFSSAVALSLQGGLQAPIPNGGTLTFGNGGAGFSATSAAGLRVDSAISAPSGDVALTGQGSVTLAADVTATTGSIAVTALSPASALQRTAGTLSATAAGQRITLTADSMDFGNPGTPVLLANAASGLVRLQAESAGLDISLGAAVAGRFSITNTTGGLVNAARLSIGDAAGGAIALGGSFDAGTTTLELLTAHGISQSAGVLAATGLSATAGGDIVLAGANRLGAINGSTADATKGLTTPGNITLADTLALTLNAAVTAGSGQGITLRADALHIAAGASLGMAGAGTVNLLPYTTGTAMQLGGTAASGFVLGDAEVARIGTGGGLLRIGSDGTATTAGAITLAGTLSLRGGAGQGNAATLELHGASVAQTTGSLDVATLTGATSGDFVAGLAANRIDTLGAVHAGGVFGFGSALALAVNGPLSADATTGLNSIGGKAGLTLAGDITTHAALALNAGGDIDQTGGAIVAPSVGFGDFVNPLGAVTLLRPGNDVAALAGVAHGAVQVFSSVATAGELTLGGITAAGVAITSAGRLTTSGDILAGNGVTLEGTGSVTLGGNVTATLGNIGITATGAGSQLRRTAGRVAAPDAAGGTITLTADSMDFGNPGAPVLLADATSGLVRLQAYSPGLAVSLGATVAGQFSVTGTTGGLVDAARLLIGDAAGGAITLGGSFNAGTTTLELLTGGAITQTAGALTTSGLSATAGGGITLDASGNAIGAINGSTADATRGITAGGDMALTSSVAQLAVNAAVAVPTAGSLTLVADDLALAARLQAPGGLIRLHPLGTAQPITLGTTATPAGFSLDSAELALIGSAGSPAARLRIGTDAGGAIAVAGNVDLRNTGSFDGDRVQVLELASAGGITQVAGTRLNVAGLAAQGQQVLLGSSANAFDTLLLGTTDAGAAATHAVNATGGDATLTTSRALTVSAAVAASNGIALTGDSLVANAAIAGGSLDLVQLVATGAGIGNNAAISGGSVSLTAQGTGITNSATGSIVAGQDVTLGAQTSIDNQAGASISAGRNLYYGQGNGEALSNAGTLAAGTGAGGGSATLNGGAVTNSGSIAAGSASLPGDISISITSSATGLWNQTGGSITAAGRLGITASALGVTNDGTLTSGIGTSGGDLVVGATQLTNTGAMQAGSASLPGAISITLGNAAGSTLAQAGTGSMAAADGIGIGTAGGAVAATLAGSVQAGLRAPADATLTLPGGSFSLSGSIGARDIVLGAAAGSTTGTAALTAGRDLTLTIGAIGTVLDGSHTAGRDLGASVTGAGNALLLGGSWVAQRNVALAAPGGIGIGGVVGTAGSGSDGVVDVQSSGGALAINAGGLLYGRRLQGALGATTSLVEVPHAAGQSGVAFAELGTLSVGGDFNVTVTDAALLPYSVNGIVSVGSGRTLQVAADDLDITSLGGLRAPGGVIAIGPFSAGRDMILGRSASGALALDSLEIGRIGSSAAAATQVVLGGTTLGATAADITFGGTVDFGHAATARTGQLAVQALGSVTQEGGATLVVDSLTGSAGGSLSLDPGGSTNRIYALADLSAGNLLSVRSDVAQLAVTGAVSVGNAGIGVQSLQLQVDDIGIQPGGSLAAPGGWLWLSPITPGRGVTLGGSAAGTLSLDGGELARIGPIARLRVGDTMASGSAVAGDITITGATTVAGLPALELRSGGSVLGSAAPVSMGLVTAVAAQDVLLDNAGNRFTVGSVTAGTGRTIRLTDPPDLVLSGPITAVGGLVALVSADAIIQQAGAVITTGTLTVQAGGQVSLPEANSFATLGASHVGGGTLRGLGFSVAGPVSADGFLTLNADGALAVPGSVGSGGTLALNAASIAVGGSLSAAGNLALAGSGGITLSGTAQAGGPITLNSFGAVALLGTTQAGGQLYLQAGGDVTMAGTVSAGADISVSAGGALGQTGSASAGGPLHLSASGGMTLAGALASGGDIATQSGGATSLTGSATAAGPLSMAAGGAFTLASAATAHAGAAMTLAAGSDLVLIGTAAAGSSLSLTAGVALGLVGTASAGGDAALTAGGALTLSGTLASGGAVSASAGGSASFSGQATAAGLFSLSASSSLVLTGTLAADSASLRGASVVLDGMVATIGRAIVFSGPGGITAGATTTIDARTAGLYPAVVFDTRRASHADPLGLVQPDVAGRLDNQQATQVRRPGVQAPGTFGATSSASAGVLTLAVSAGSSPVFLLLDGGIASGTIVAGRVGIQGTGGSASLLGPLAGVPGSAAAASADITRPIDPTLQSNYRINGCVVASINCVPPPSVQFVSLRPPEVVDLSLVNNRIDTTEVTIPNVAETESE